MLRLVYLVNFLITASIGVVFVFLADLQERFDLATWEIGAIAAAGFVAALIAQLVLAPLADRGDIKRLAIVAVTISAVGTLGFVFATQTWTLAGSRALVGAGLGLYGVAARKAIIGMDIEGAGAKVGTFLSTSVAGFLAGPPIGAILEQISFETPFWVLGIAIAVLGIPTIGIIGRTDVATAPVDYSDLGDLLRRPRVQAAVFAQVSLFGFIGIFDASLDVYLTDLGASNAATAGALLIIGLPLLVLPRFAGSVAEKRGGARVLMPTFLAIVPAIAFFGIFDTVPLVAAVGVVETTGESFAFLAIQMLLLEVTGAQRAAVGQALLEAAGLTAAAITALAGPIVYGAFGPIALFVGYATVAGVLAIAALMRLRAAVEPAVVTP